MMLDPTGRGSFESFFREHYASLVRSLVVVSGGKAEAKTWHRKRSLERWGRVSEMESPVGYVYRTAFNLNRNRLRRLARSLRRRTHPEPENDPASEVETRNEIRRVLASLPASQREALVLVEWLGLDADEAGRVLGIEAASVRGRIHGAKRTIQNHLGGEDV